MRLLERHVICNIEKRFIFLREGIFPITQTLITNAIKRLQDADPNKKINFYITGVGGDSHVSFRIYQAMRRTSMVVNTICVDFVKSGSLLISQAGKKRFATEETKFIFHMARDTEDGIMEVLKNEDLNGEKHLKMAKNLFLLDAMQLLILGEKGRPFSEIKNLLSTNAEISAEKALQLNLIDGILPKSKIPKI